jgi:hypothetical protein
MEAIATSTEPGIKQKEPEQIYMCRHILERVKFVVTSEINFLVLCGMFQLIYKIPNALPWSETRLLVSYFYYYSFSHFCLVAKMLLRLFAPMHRKILTNVYFP